MNQSYDRSRIRKLLLLAALVGGIGATQLVPPFEELAFRPSDDEAASGSTRPVATSRGMTGMNVGKHPSKAMRRTG